MEVGYFEVGYNNKIVSTALLNTTQFDRIALFLPVSLFQLMEVAVKRRVAPPPTHSTPIQSSVSFSDAKTQY
jgi:hypothetical protein